MTIEVMQWGDVTEWIAIGLSLVAAGRAIWQARGAKKDAVRAEERANQALVASQSMADSSVKMAASLAEISANAKARAPAEGDRSNTPQPSGTPVWSLEYRTGSAYVLRNVGTATANKVTIDAGASIAKNLPAVGGVTLQPGQGHELMLIAAMGSPVPASLTVDCAELGRQHVPVPAKR